MCKLIGYFMPMEDAVVAGDVFACWDQQRNMSHIEFRELHLQWRGLRQFQAKRIHAYYHCAQRCECQIRPAPDDALHAWTEPGFGNSTRPPAVKPANGRVSAVRCFYVRRLTALQAATREARFKQRLHPRPEEPFSAVDRVVGSMLRWMERKPPRRLVLPRLR